MRNRQRYREIDRKSNVYREGERERGREQQETKKDREIEKRMRNREREIIKSLEN